MVCVIVICNKIIWCPSNDIAGRALVASVYRVPFCLSARAAKLKILFALCVSSLGSGSNSGRVCWTLGWISVVAILVFLFLP